MSESLRQLELGPGMAALDAGSSTQDFRRSTQPHVERNVLGPLAERGVEVRSLDIRAAPGVDYVCDLTASDFDWSTTIGRRFELVLCNNVLPHLSDPISGAGNVASLVAPGGWLLASTPAAYRRVRDPQDNGIRPDPAELTELLIGSGDGAARFEVMQQEQLRIDQRSYYRWSARPSWLLVGSRWLPVPGFVEQLRYLRRSWRWRVSCVLLHRLPETA